LFRRGDALSAAKQAGMIRWTDGLLGGTIAGFITAIYYIVVGGAITHDTTFTSFFTDISGGIFGPRVAALGAVAVILGIVLHFLMAGFFGMVYAFVAARFKQMWSAPTSVLCGTTYGLVVYFTVHDVIVPIFGIPDFMPLWEGILGDVLFFGLILSEYITIAHRRNLARAA
jgi:hypothetical protein